MCRRRSHKDLKEAGEAGGGGGGGKERKGSEGSGVKEGEREEDGGKRQRGKRGRSSLWKVFG